MLATSLLTSLPTATTDSLGILEENTHTASIGYWSSVPCPANSTLYSVTMISADDGWAVGQNGTILHWGGDHWEEVSSPTSSTLYSVAMVSADDGWAAGEGGTILHWNGYSWDEVASPTTQTLHSVTMTSSGDVWIVGGELYFTGDTAGGIILRWDGASWSVQEVQYYLYSIAMVSPDDGWIGGYEEYHDFDPPFAGYENTVMLERDDVTWGVHTLWPDLWLRICSIAMISADAGWAVGYSVSPDPGSGIIKRWDGESWQPVANPTSNGLLSVDIVSASNGWAVGRAGSIIHWDGTSWQSVASPTSRDLFSVAMVSADDGWAVGGTWREDGVILRYWVPTEWRYLPVIVKNLGP
ncbi:MAG: YCF48-related protein [Chloroflexota bacterium]|nr:YCF48-related protein [Chloroflexota bacterium]